MTEEFRILDLFSGAGGFSYGIEKNKHFKTLVASDINEAALYTFSRNFPDATTISGDITLSSNMNLLENFIIMLLPLRNVSHPRGRRWLHCNLEEI